jgi:anti-sigma B factor antagonist
LLNDIAVVEASGRLCIESASSLGDAVREAIQLRGRRLVLNLVDVSRVDAAGLGELAGAFRVVRAAAAEMKVVVRSPAVRDLLARTHLLPLFPTYESEAAALASFEGGRQCPFI